MVILVVLAVLLAITLLVALPIYASLLTVPLYLARRARGAFESEIVEGYQEEEV